MAEVLDGISASSLRSRSRLLRTSGRCGNCNVSNGGSTGEPIMEELVASVLRVMSHGSGFSSLVRTTSGRHFVMKLSGVGHGEPGLMTELIATRLADLFGLKVPRVAPIMLGKDLPWQTGTDEFYDALQRSAGWNLGVEFVNHARDLTLDDLATIPSEFLDRLAGVDAILQ